MNRAEEIRVAVTVSEEKPNYKKTASALLDACRKFYQDPENEKAFQEWQRTRKEKAC